LDGKQTESQNLAFWTEKRNSEFWTENGEMAKRLPEKNCQIHWLYHNVFGGNRCLELLWWEWSTFLSQNERTHQTAV